MISLLVHMMRIQLRHKLPSEKGLYVVSMECGFLSQNGGEGGRGIKEKQQCLANVAEKDTIVVSSPAVDEPMDATVNTEDVSVGQTNSPTVNPKPDSSNDHSNLGHVTSTSTLDETVAKDSEDGLSAIATKLAMIELRADVELKDNIVADMPKITRKGYYTCNICVEYEWKPHSQTPKENVELAKKASKSDPFEVLTSVENYMELSENGGTLNLASQAINSSGSSFWNVDASSPSTTFIVVKIDKIEKLIIEGKVTLMDDEGKPLKKSLLEQWTESYENADYGYDLYDDDMYEGQDISDKLQAIYDKLDITVRGRRKK
uniref:Uncharacterized protein n=1 Tax=Tanacetum cinerariifolium TaxID=118510 RepID=A0A699GVR3_TANCI|nr:hypothetical protein [Tanacetum cinerariifolium]